MPINLQEPYYFTEKEKSIAYYTAYMLCRTQQIFDYENLPQNIKKRNLEYMLQSNGNVCITAVNGSLYALTGGLGGEPDPYYMPTIYTVSNPALKYSKNLKINEECILIPNDSLYIGLLPLFKKYATLLCENDLTMKMVDVATRAMSLISAPDDRTKNAAIEYLNQLEAGKNGVIGESAFLDGIKVQPYSSGASGRGLTELIEYEQYLKAGWYNEIGLQSNYNMKRESINSNEAQLNEDSLMPFIDDMLECRKIGMEKVNDLYGTNINVKLNSVWGEKNDFERSDTELV